MLRQVKKDAKGVYKMQLRPPGLAVSNPILCPQGIDNEKGAQRHQVGHRESWLPCTPPLAEAVREIRGYAPSGCLNKGCRQTSLGTKVFTVIKAH